MWRGSVPLHILGKSIFPSDLYVIFPGPSAFMYLSPSGAQYSVASISYGASKYSPYIRGLLPYCSRPRYLTRVNGLSGWYSLVGVFAAERMITIEKSENPITIIVKHRSTVLANTCCFFMVLKSPQKHAPSSTAMKNTAPLLKPMPSLFTKKRSNCAAIFGRYGMIPKSITARMMTETAKILTYSLKL